MTAFPRAWITFSEKTRRSSPVLIGDWRMELRPGVVGAGALARRLGVIGTGALARILGGTFRAGVAVVGAPSSQQNATAGADAGASPLGGIAGVGASATGAGAAVAGAPLVPTSQPGGLTPRRGVHAGELTRMAGGRPIAGKASWFTGGSDGGDSEEVAEGDAVDPAETHAIASAGQLRTAARGRACTWRSAGIRVPLGSWRRSELAGQKRRWISSSAASAPETGCVSGSASDPGRPASTSEPGGNMIPSFPTSSSKLEFVLSADSVLKVRYASTAGCGVSIHLQDLI